MTLVALALVVAVCAFQALVLSETTKELAEVRREVVDLRWRLANERERRFPQWEI